MAPSIESLVELAYEGLLRWAICGLVLLLCASVAVLLVRQPARCIRVIQLALAGLVALPCLLLVPGYPSLAIVPGISTSPSTVQRRGADEPAHAAGRFDPTNESVVDELAFEAESTATEDGATAAERAAPSPERARGHLESRRLTDPRAAAKGGSEPTHRFNAGASPAAEPPAESRRSPSEVGAPTAPPSAPVAPNPRAWLVAAYGTGVLAMAAWSLIGMLAVRRLLRAAEPAPAVCRILLRAIGGPASDRVALIVSTRAAQPSALWWRTATIVLPRELAAGGDVQALRWALAHEWSHVQRGDLATWTASGIVRWFYFYQPLVWWLRGQLQLCQDYLADAAAARSGQQPEDYAEFLTTSRFTRSTLAAGLGIGGRISDLQRRIIMLVERRRPLESRIPRLWNLAALPIVIVIVATTAGLAQKQEPVAAEAPAVRSKAPTEVEAVTPPEPVDPAQPPSELEPVAPIKPVENVAPVAETIEIAQPTIAPIAPVKPARNPRTTKSQAAVPPVAAPRAPAEPADAPAGNAPAAPSGPRRIAPGDTLTIDVMDNLDSLGVLGLKLLLRPTTTVVVDADGQLPLGNVYGSIKVAGSTLGKAEGYLSSWLRDRIRASVPQLDTTDERHKSFVDSLNHIEINVRLSYTAAASDDAIKRAVEWLKRSQVGDTSKPAASGPTVSPNLNLLDPRSQSQHERIAPGDVLNIEVDKPGANVRPVSIVESDGNIPLGVKFGRVNVAGKTLSEAEKIIADCVAKFFDGPEVQVTYAVRSAGGISGQDSAGSLDAKDWRIGQLERQVDKLTATINRLERALDKEHQQEFKSERR